MVNDRLLNRLGAIIGYYHLMIQLTHLSSVGMTERLRLTSEKTYLCLLRQSTPAGHINASSSY